MIEVCYDQSMKSHSQGAWLDKCRPWRVRFHTLTTTLLPMIIFTGVSGTRVEKNMLFYIILILIPLKIKLNTIFYITP